MPQYIEKIRVPVVVARVGVPPVAGRLSVLPLAELHEGPETLLELLNAPARVLPLELDGDEGVLLLARARIEWVEPGAGVDARFVRPATWMTTREENVCVRLAGGEQLEGVLAMEMPHEFNRASDYLNTDEDFFPLRTDAGTRLIHKARVVDVLVRGTVAVPRVA